jgi:2-oxoglutarate dehydrogenase E1 component
MTSLSEWLSSENLDYVEELYVQYLRAPESVPEGLRPAFAELARGDGRSDRRGPSFRPASLFHGAASARAARRSPSESAAPSGSAAGPAAPTGAAGDVSDWVSRAMAFAQSRVDQLVRNWRVRGHMAAGLDPLGARRPVPPELAPEYYGFGAEDLARTFAAPDLEPAGSGLLALGQILERLRATYGRSIGAQFMHIDDAEVRGWLQRRMEHTQNHIQLGRAEQLRILKRLTSAVIFEEFLQKKFLGAKRFSLEGGESLIPLLDLAIERAAEHGVVEIVLAMAHRGRVNVLRNVLAKDAAAIFREFADEAGDARPGRGDVKYHLGHGHDWVTASGGKVHLSLCFNPSHLEFVNPVALGRMRAKQDRYGDREGAKGLVILIHGDAAFAGQGVVQETLNLSDLPAYATGGTIHVVVDNQIGFTTDPEQSRSSVYATDVAKMLQIPILHVNGEDPEAVAQVVHLALDFRSEFRRDVVIDMYCYRRYGHNEGDEPAFTQPLMYKVVRARKSVREGYLEHLLELGGITRSEADRVAVEEREHLERELTAAKDPSYRPREGYVDLWGKVVGGREEPGHDVDTSVERARLRELLRASARLPDGFTPHPKLARILEDRRAMAEIGLPLDWAAGEALAFASLATEGHPVRLTGQDSERGTFSHRHAVLHDVETGATWTPLQHLDPAQAGVTIANSPLSEVGVLGFEYGYSLDCPDGLVMWEAQFGDFSNVAQVIVDQFLVSAEDKWRRLSALVLLLPHGYEGQGPEHSSARLERFLSLAAEDNIQVVQPTTPAQVFHVLRRQVKRPWRKPLVVLTPKSLLRHPRAVSRLDDFASGRFQRVIGDAGVAAAAVGRIVLSSGKLHYELEDARERARARDVALVRLEQIYPLPARELGRILGAFPPGAPLVWVQDEPENMGAAPFLRLAWDSAALGRPLAVVARPPSASPATGSSASHKLEAQALAERALGTG